MVLVFVGPAIGSAADHSLKRKLAGSDTPPIKIISSVGDSETYAASEKIALPVREIGWASDSQTACSK
jgi:hypothetical protein